MFHPRTALAYQLPFVRNSLCADDRLWQNLYLKKWNRKEQGTNSSDTEQELQTLQPIPSSPRILTRDRREAIVDPPPISLMLNGSTSIDSSQPVPPSGIQLRTETISGGSTPPHSPGRPKKVAQIGSMRRSAEARPVEGTLNNFDLLRSLQQLPQVPPPAPRTPPAPHPQHYPFSSPNTRSLTYVLSPPHRHLFPKNYFL